MKVLIVLGLLVAFIACVSADTIQVAPDGIYVSSIVDGTLVTKRVIPIGPGDTLVIHGGPNDPPPPAPDPPSDVTAKVKQITADHIQDELEARALLGAIRIINRPRAKLSEAKSRLAQAIDLFADNNPLFPEGDRFRSWLTEIDQISPDPYTREFLAALDAGVRAATGISDVSMAVVEQGIRNGTMNARTWVQTLLRGFGRGGIAERDWSNLLNLLLRLLELFIGSGFFANGG